MPAISQRLILLFACIASGTALADDFFESKVRPLLIEHCYKCHSESAGKRKGNFWLDRRAGWQTGGDSGPAIVPLKPDQSLLIKAVTYDDPDLQMPPDYQLEKSEVAVLRQWIRNGAADPRTGKITGSATGIDIVAGRKHWSFQPVGNPPVPKTRNNNWAANDIDRFVLSELESKGFQPAKPASRTVLLRRLYIDLIGWPPTPGRIREFDAGRIPFADIVDELLASRQFGERWARHWLDLARYADSSGGGASKPFPNAWQYRNYVIDSYHSDKPFDTFIREQLAGDLLPHKDIAQRREQLVATGFLVLGPRNYINDDPAAFEMDGVDEQLDTIGRTFLGLTIGCARCHDHKFDPIPTKDYYAMAGFLTSTESADRLAGTKNYTWNVVADPLADLDGSLLRDYEVKYLAYRDENKRLSNLKAAKGSDAAAIKSLTAQVANLRAQIPKRPAILMGVKDVASPADCRLRVRGDPRNLGDPVPRNILQVIAGRKFTAPHRQSGRRQLADWIASPTNPLTARVYVNRVWKHLFGDGLVRTPDHFGLKGETPSHPELLDALTHRFVHNSWSTKQLIKLIVHSRTYQLGEAEPGSLLLKNDPANRLFGRRVRRSLDAETLRDSILFISGTLDQSIGEIPFPKKLRSEFTHTETSPRHSIYLPRFRNHLNELFSNFDAANPAVTIGSRNDTILPTQALFLMNAELPKMEAHETTKKLLNLDGVNQRIETTYLQTLGRRPTPDEIRITKEFLHGHENSLEHWTDLQHSLFSSVDFRFVR